MAPVSTLGALAELSGARLLRPDDSERLFHDVSPLETAGPDNHGPDANEVRKAKEMHARATGG